MEQVVATLRSGSGEKMNASDIRSLLDLLIQSGDEQIGGLALRRATEKLGSEEGVTSLSILAYCREQEGWTNLTESDAESIIDDWEQALAGKLRARSPSDTSADTVVDEGSQPAELPEKMGPYLIEALIGEGGFGLVYRAFHQSLPGQAYAVKVLRGFEDPEKLERFRLEALAHRRITHPNVVCVFDVILEHDPPYMVLEWVDGKAFDVIVLSMISTGRLTGAMRLFRDVCLGVQAYHLAELIHRDLKPDNVLVVVGGGTERPVVLDPLVKFLSGRNGNKAEEKESTVDSAAQLQESGEVSQDGAIIGTPLYMAPEQIDPTRAPIGPAADVYALGKMLFKALTGADVHPGTSGFDICSKVLKEQGVPKNIHGDLRAVIAKRAHADRICAIISKCLEPDPEKRYKNAGQLVKVLNDYLDFVREEERKKQRGSRRMRTWLLVLLLAVVAGSSVALDKINRDRKRKVEDARQAQAMANRQKERADIQTRIANEERAKAEAEFKRAQAESERATTQAEKVAAEIKMGLALKSQVEAERKATEAAQGRVATEIESRKKVEALLEQLRVQNTIMNGLFEAGDAMKEWRWPAARDEFEKILALAPESYKIRKPRAQVMFNLNDPACVEEYRWLAAQHQPDTQESKQKRWEFQLMAMIALTDLSRKHPKEKLAAVTEMHQDLKEEPYRSAGWILVQDATIAELRSRGENVQADRAASALKKRVIELYTLNPDSALANYVLGIHVEPYFLERTRAIALLGAAHAKNPGFFPSIMARQRNARFVVEEFGTDYERSADLLKSAHDDLLLLRERLPCRPEIDMAYVDCLVTKTRLRVFRHEEIGLIEEALKVAGRYLRLRGRAGYKKHAYLIEFRIAYAYAAKYRWAKVKHQRAEAFKKVAQAAFAKANKLGFRSGVPKLKQHDAKRIKLIRIWLR